jgi:long-chain acyl-CoA synthetase
MTYDEKPWLKSYDPQVKPEIQIPEISLVDYYESVAKKYENRPAFYFLGLSFTYGEFIERANRFAQALIQNGCKRGDVVAINLPNLPQFLIALSGALKAGCAASGVSPLLTGRELAYQLNDSKAKVLVTFDAIFENRLKAIAGDVPHLKLIVVTGILDFLPKYKQLLGRWLKKVPHGKVTPLPDKQVIKFMDILFQYPSKPPEVELGPQDHCIVQYTGGTTGVPKGTVLTHRNLLANTIQVLEWTDPRYGEEVVISGFPFFHLAGLALGGAALAMGGAQVLIPNPRDTKHMVREMAKYLPSMLVNVPSLYMMLLEEPGFRDLNFSGLSYCLSGASPFPAESIRELEAVVGEGRVLEVYGMTETSPIITMNPRRGQKKIGSVGLPVASTSVRLVDLETGTQSVPVGEEGELIVAGPQVMKGYLNKPEETAIAMKEHDGVTWLHTGDVARMDEDGFFAIVDRTKDMLSVGGYKVFSREVEEKLYENPNVELCAIVGVPNPKRPGSDIVKLVLQPSQLAKEKTEEALKKEILAFARENLAPYKIPKIIEVIEEIPLTPVGKVDKKALR